MHISFFLFWLDVLRLSVIWDYISLYTYLPIHFCANMSNKHVQHRAAQMFFSPFIFHMFDSGIYLYIMLLLSALALILTLALTLVLSIYYWIVHFFSVLSGLALFLVGFYSSRH